MDYERETAMQSNNNIRNILEKSNKVLNELQEVLYHLIESILTSLTLEERIFACISQNHGKHQTCMRSYGKRDHSTSAKSSVHAASDYVNNEDRLKKSIDEYDKKLTRMECKIKSLESFIDKLQNDVVKKDETIVSVCQKYLILKRKFDKVKV